MLNELYLKIICPNCGACYGECFNSQISPLNELESQIGYFSISFANKSKCICCGMESTITSQYRKGDSNKAEDIAIVTTLFRNGIEHTIEITYRNPAYEYFIRYNVENYIRIEKSTTIAMFGCIKIGDKIPVEEERDMLLNMINKDLEKIIKKNKILL